MAVDLIKLYLAIVLIAASVIDIRSLRIPNWLTYSTLAVGISYLSITKGYEGFLLSLAGAAAGVGLLVFPYIMGGTGAGDVKLMGAVGSFLGAQGIFMVFILSCILAGAYALFLLATEGLLLGTLKRYGKILWCFMITRNFIYIPPSMKEKALKLRFGLAIAIGTFSYLIFGNLLT